MSKIQYTVVNGVPAANVPGGYIRIMPGKDNLIRFYSHADNGERLGRFDKMAYAVTAILNYKAPPTLHVIN